MLNVWFNVLISFVSKNILPTVLSFVFLFFFFSFRNVQPKKILLVEAGIPLGSSLWACAVLG